MMTEEKAGKMTIDKLASMMNTAFEDIREKMATKDDIKHLEERFDKVDMRLDMVEGRLETVENSLERIESKVDNRQENRISKLEDDVRVLKTTIGK